MWSIACDINRGAAWDDEVFEALAARGFFDETAPEPAAQTEAANSGS